MQQNPDRTGIDEVGKYSEQRNDLSQEAFRGIAVLFKHRSFPSQLSWEELPMTPSSRSEAEKFHKEAEECRQLAEKAANPQDKEAWARLAEDWLKLAQEAERGTRFGRTV
ncbi:hypothetical protein [Bradyrhizobium sp. BWA-3-5]|uniref:hypothetical protein n=1 Tax=Bradyrhizobium sp. BWA-3-5 TaxID=3080013 RepID=UPI00293EE985|nr:hypothetical protein [Bradyrhizobium sp. BWA-3-5]WOH67992.1 hypothetical protein RX331_09855 [Bradyrhizobium sp. BWA-3-5]